MSVLFLILLLEIIIIIIFLLQESKMPRDFWLAFKVSPKARMPFSLSPNFSGSPLNSHNTSNTSKLYVYVLSF